MIFNLFIQKTIFGICFVESSKIIIIVLLYAALEVLSMGQRAWPHRSQFKP